MKKIKVTKRQYKRIVLAYRIVVFLFILGALIAYSLFLNKGIEFILIFIPYFITRNWYRSQFHANSLKKCFLLSIALFAFAITVTMPREYSICCSLVIGLLLAFVSYKASKIQLSLYHYAELTNYKFDVNNCTEQELRERCRELNLSKENTELAVELFINKTKQSILANRLCIDEYSITMRKMRLKDKLNK